MKKVYAACGNAITSLGMNTPEQISRIEKNESGIRLVNDLTLAPQPFFTGLTDSIKLESYFEKINRKKASHTRFEKLVISSIQQSLDQCPEFDAGSPETVFIISSTKGNIDLLEEKNKGVFPAQRLFLWDAARQISRFFGNNNPPLLISNACISGVLAIIYGFDLLQTGRYKNAVIAGGDIVSEFVAAGFQSFKSLTYGICKPFDASRDGLNLGEGAGSVLLTLSPELMSPGQRVCVSGGGSSNDANHISGPSRTGEGLLNAVNKALAEAGIAPEAVDFISAHGTATPFNDEMESKAFSRAGLSDVPLNSLKAYFGHTLGAAGIVESVISIYGMLNGRLFGTLGYREYGVPEKITIVDKHQNRQQHHILKTASGFGGCNAAVIFSRS